MFIQGSVLFTVSFCPRQAAETGLKSSIMWNKVKTGSKASPHTHILVCPRHTKSGRTMAESDNMTAAMADVSLATDWNAA